MNTRCSLFTMLAVLVVIGSAFAQDNSTQTPHARFARIPMHQVPAAKGNPAALQTFSKSEKWTGDPTASKTIVEVGTDPSLTNTTTTIPVVIIPIAFQITSGGTKYTFNPAQHKLSNGKTVIANTIASPIFSTGIDFVQGGTDLGDTQYEDAYVRGDWWTNVMTNTDYHLILGTPTVLPAQVLIVPSNKGTVTKNPFGAGKVGNVDITWFDTQVQKLLTKDAITANELPIFEYYDTYLTEGGCCIGGYHSANSNGQTYSTFDYEDVAGSFSQDVSALSHEIGEWIVDPLITDDACGGLMEVGDPLENDANYGGFPYTLNGFTYNLQDLVYLQYFGQTPSTSNNDDSTFQGAKLAVCVNGQ